MENAKDVEIKGAYKLLVGKGRSIKKMISKDSLLV